MTTFISTLAANYPAAEARLAYHCKLFGNVHGHNVYISDNIKDGVLTSMLDAGDIALVTLTAGTTGGIIAKSLTPFEPRPAEILDYTSQPIPDHLVDELAGSRFTKKWNAAVEQVSTWDL